MNVIDILSHVINLLLYPDRGWKVIVGENHDRRTVFLRFVVPLLCLITVASMVGSLLFASRMLFSFGYIVCRVTVLWCSLGAGLYLASFVITEITARQIVGAKDHHKVFTLMAYASSATYLVIMIVELFPFFSELLVLAFYSCYLYWKGIPYLMGIRGQKQMMFFLLSLVIVALVFSLVFYFFGNILKAIFL